VQKTLIALLATVALAAFGCKKKGSEGGADMMGKMTDLKNRMCACSAGDKACADKINDEMKKWSEEHAKKGDHAADPEMTKKMDPINKELADCMTKAMTPVGEGSAAAGHGGMDHGSGHTPGSGSAMGSDHGGMDHGSGHAHGSGSAMGSGHGGMDHGSGHPHAGSAKK